MRSTKRLKYDFTSHKDTLVTKNMKNEQSWGLIFTHACKAVFFPLIGLKLCLFCSDLHRWCGQRCWTPQESRPFSPPLRPWSQRSPRRRRICQEEAWEAWVAWEEWEEWEAAWVSKSTPTSCCTDSDWCRLWLRNRSKQLCPPRSNPGGT